MLTKYEWPDQMNDQSCQQSFGWYVILFQVDGRSCSRSEMCLDRMEVKGIASQSLHVLLSGWPDGHLPPFWELFFSASQSSTRCSELMPGQHWMQLLKPMKMHIQRLDQYHCYIVQPIASSPHMLFAKKIVGLLFLLPFFFSPFLVFFGSDFAL